MNGSYPVTNSQSTVPTTVEPKSAFHSMVQPKKAHQLKSQSYRRYGRKEVLPKDRSFDLSAAPYFSVSHGYKLDPEGESSIQVRRSKSKGGVKQSSSKPMTRHRKAESLTIRPELPYSFSNCRTPVRNENNRDFSQNKRCPSSGIGIINITPSQKSFEGNKTSK